MANLRSEIEPFTHSGRAVSMSTFLSEKPNKAAVVTRGPRNQRCVTSEAKASPLALSCLVRIRHKNASRSGARDRRYSASRGGSSRPAALRWLMTISALAAGGTLPAASRRSSGCSGGSYGESIPVKWISSPRRAFAYRPLRSRASATSRGTSTCTSMNSPSPSMSRASWRSARKGEMNEASTMTPASISRLVISATRRMFSTRSASVNPRSRLSP